MTRDPIEPTESIKKAEKVLHDSIEAAGTDEFASDGYALGGELIEHIAKALDAARLEARKDFSKQILDMLDEVVRGTPELQSFIYPIKESIREVRDNQELQGLRGSK